MSTLTEIKMQLEAYLKESEDTRLDYKKYIELAEEEWDFQIYKNHLISYAANLIIKLLNKKRKLTP